MTRDELLNSARAVVNGDREDTYGGPEDSFTAIANVWNSYLELTEPPLEAHDVALMMTLLKIVRLAASNGNHKDSWIDLAGYAACGASCVDFSDEENVAVSGVPYPVSKDSLQQTIKEDPDLLKEGKCCFCKNHTQVYTATNLCPVCSARLAHKSYVDLVT